MSTTKKLTFGEKPWTYWLHLAIGLSLMFLFPLLPPIEPITVPGMKILGAFLGMVYLWSTLDSVWPSLVGLVLVARSGFLEEQTGYAAIKTVFTSSIGAEIAITVLLGLFLFAALNNSGCTKYIVRFFLTRKILEGRPYVLMFLIFFTAVLISGFTLGVAALLVLWPIGVDILTKFGYKKGDKIFYVMACGIYLGTSLGQPLLPFKGGIAGVVSSMNNTFGIEVNYVSFMLISLVMSIIMLIFYLIIVRFIIRPDVATLKDIKVEDILQEELPPMNFQQKMTFGVMIFLFACMLLPNFIKNNPITDLINSLGTNGMLIVCIAIMMIVPYKGKDVLDFKNVAKGFNFGVFLLVAAALYTCNLLTNPVTGIKEFIVIKLQPILGGHSDIVFVFIILLFALLLTQVTNNAGMGAALMPIVAAFVDQYPGINVTALGTMVALMVYIPLLTPAASPYCSMLYGRKDLVDLPDIEKVFVPTALVAIFVYVFVGYNFANIIFH